MNVLARVDLLRSNEMVDARESLDVDVPEQSTEDPGADLLLRSRQVAVSEEHGKGAASQ
jgi:hypothetical protein